MPIYVVTFQTIAIDQPDHPKAQKQVDGLRVHAPDAQSACFHAARVTRGGIPSAVYDEAGALVWGAGPEAILIPSPVAPVVETSQGETAEVFGF